MASDLAAQEPEPQPLTVAVGVGYALPLTSLGTFGAAQGRIGASPTVGLSVGVPIANRWAVTLSAIAGVRRSIEVEPSPACQGTCHPVTFDGRGRFVAAGADIAFSVGGRSLTFLAGPWIRSYVSGRTVNVCDLDAYCQSASYFIPSDTHLSVRVGARWRPSRQLPLAVEASDVIGQYRTGAMQHHASLMVLVVLFR